MQKTVQNMAQHRKRSCVGCYGGNNALSMSKLGWLRCSKRFKLLTTSLLAFLNMSLMAWDWEYDEKRDGTIEIIGIDIDEEIETPPSVLSIPAKIEGKPVTSIGDTFADEVLCSSLTSVTIPSTVTHIGDGAFAFCEKLSNVELSDIVTSIGEGAFANCGKLLNVELPDSVTSIGDQAFSSCGLKNITLGNGVTSIGKMAFVLCKDLTDVTIPGSVKYIGDFAFGECNGLKRVSMGDGVKNIGKSVFSGCRNLESVTIPDSVTSIGENAFDGCIKLGEKIVLPHSLTTVSEHVFQGCINLKEVVFHEDIGKIGEGAFMASGVTNIDLQATKVVEISKDTFWGCAWLSKIVLPATVKSISDEAFYYIGSTGNPAFIVFRGLPPSCGEKVFEQYLPKYPEYYDQSPVQRRNAYSVSHTVFGAYMPDDKSANVNAWSQVIEADGWGRWNEVQMVMDVKPIACDYATDNCGELNISWMAFSAYTNDFQKEFWYGKLEDLGGMDWDECYLRENWLVLSQMKYSIWRSNEDPDKPYDDFSCASNIAQHVGGVFSAAKGFSATNFIDKTFGKFKGTKPVKYWIEIEDPDDPDNLRYLSSGETAPSTRIRPIVEPDSCVTRKRYAHIYGFNPPAHRHTLEEATLLRDVLLQKDWQNNCNLDAKVKDVSSMWSKLADDTIPGDIVLFYISTHGGSKANGRNFAALQMWDHVYESKDMVRDLAKFPVTNGVKVINIINACFSGAMYKECSADPTYESENKAWICAAQHDQKADCVQVDSQFAVAFLKWGWEQRCADVSSLRNVTSYRNDTANDGNLTLWEVANYSRALVSGSSSVANEDTRMGLNKADYPFTQNILIEGENLLRHTTIVTGVQSVSGNVPPEVSIDTYSGKDFEYKYIEDKHEFVMIANKVDRNIFYDVKYSSALAGEAWVRILPAEFFNGGAAGGTALKICEYGHEYDVANGNKRWLNIYGKPGEWETTGLGREYVPLGLNAEYQVAIRGVNQFGFGEWSIYGNFKTRKGFFDMIRDSEYEEDQSINGIIERMFSSDEKIKEISLYLDNISEMAGKTGNQKKSDTLFMSRDASALEMSLFLAVQVKYATGQINVYSGNMSFDKSSNVFIGNVMCGNEEMSITIDKNDVVTGNSLSLTFSGPLVLSNQGVSAEKFCTVVLNPVGGVVSPAICMVTSGTAVGALPTPSRTGYTFVGWFTAASGGSQVSAETIVATNVMFYAHWTPVGSGSGGGEDHDPVMTQRVWTVTFDLNYADATGRVPPMVVTNGCAVGELPVVTRDGYDFDGWFTAVNVGSRVLDDFVVVTNLTLYAHWTEVPPPLPPEPEMPMLWPDADATGRVPPVACVYDGYLCNKVTGALAGTIQVKVGKAKLDKKTQSLTAAVKATVVGLDGKKKSLKAAEKGKAKIEDDGVTEIELVGGEACTVTLGAKGMSGSYGSYDIDGALNVFTSKDAADKAAAAAVLAKWKGAVNVAWRADATERVPPYNTLSVSIANKGKVKVAGTLADGTKVSASGQLSVGEEWCCVPVVVSKKSVNLQFAVWLPAATSAAAPVVVGLGDDVKVGKPGTLKGGAAFRIDADAFAARWGQRALPYLPDGVAVGGGAKWTLPKAGSVAYAKGTTTVDETKAGENPSGLKLTYKAKDGTFKGSFKAYADVGGKPKATKVDVTGVLVDGVGYGAATVKKVGGVAVTVE